MEIKKNRIYEFKLIEEPTKINYLVVTSNNLVSKYFCRVYDINKKKLEIVKLGKRIFNYVDNCKEGFYGNYNRNFLCDNKSGRIDHYYSDDIYDDIRLDKSYLSSKNLQKKEDVILYDPINLLDRNINYGLSFRTNDKHGLINYYDIKFIETEKIDINEEEIEKLNLEEYIEDNNKEIVEWGEARGFEYIIGGQEVVDKFFEEIQRIVF